MVGTVNDDPDVHVDDVPESLNEEETPPEKASTPTEPDPWNWLWRGFAGLPPESPPPPPPKAKKSSKSSAAKHTSASEKSKKKLAARRAAVTAENTAKQADLAHHAIEVRDFAYALPNSAPSPEPVQPSHEQAPNQQSREPVASAQSAAQTCGHASPNLASPANVQLGSSEGDSVREADLASRDQSHTVQTPDPAESPSVPETHPRSGSSSACRDEAVPKETDVSPDQGSAQEQPTEPPARHDRIAQLQDSAKPKGIRKRKPKAAAPPRRSGYNLRSGRIAVATGDRNAEQEADVKQK
ncbi:unnamed protein product [Discula destructiva]